MSDQNSATTPDPLDLSRNDDIAAAVEAYDAIERPAWKAYEAIERAALEAYDASGGASWKAYEASIAPAWQAYEAAESAARKVLIEATFVPLLAAWISANDYEATGD